AQDQSIPWLSLIQIHLKILPAHPIIWMSRTSYTIQIYLGKYVGFLLFKHNHSRPHLLGNSPLWKHKATMDGFCATICVYNTNIIRQRALLGVNPQQWR
ncbi:hypothetical protein ACJX0J_013768, partial [Zea mays]